jgi:thiol-disulfide isomerase/thioredoxin
MKLINKSLFYGLGLGVALTLVILDVWGGRYKQQLYLAGVPPLLRPFTQEPAAVVPASSDRLPKPWVPESSSGAHDNWHIRSLDGKLVELSAFKGKVVFLNFWATYCGPCLAEMPGIERLARSLNNEDVVFLAVTREKPERVQEFLRKNRLAIPIYLWDEKLPPDLLVDGVPTTYILDRNGNAVYCSGGGSNWDDDGVRSFIRSLERH